MIETILRKRKGGRIVVYREDVCGTLILRHHTGKTFRLQDQLLLVSLGQATFRCTESWYSIQSDTYDTKCRHSILDHIMWKQNFLFEFPYCISFTNSIDL
jgi:hypothetical protein